MLFILKPKILLITNNRKFEEEEKWLNVFCGRTLLILSRYNFYLKFKGEICEKHKIKFASSYEKTWVEREEGRILNFPSTLWSVLESLFLVL